MITAAIVPAEAVEMAIMVGNLDWTKQAIVIDISYQSNR